MWKKLWSIKHSLCVSKWVIPGLAKIVLESWYTKYFLKSYLKHLRITNVDQFAIFGQDTVWWSQRLLLHYGCHVSLPLDSCGYKRYILRHCFAFTSTLRKVFTNLSQVKTLPKKQQWDNDSVMALGHKQQIVGGGDSLRPTDHRQMSPSSYYSQSLTHAGTIHAHSLV